MSRYPNDPDYWPELEGQDDDHDDGDSTPLRYQPSPNRRQRRAALSNMARQSRRRARHAARRRKAVGK